VIDFISVALGEHHQLDEFDCGVPSLNEWLTTQAKRAKSSGTAMTHVWVEHGSDHVVAYHAVAPHLLQRNEVSRSLSGGVSSIPCYLLGRLALDRALQGLGLGGQLLRDALETILEAAAVGGGRLVVVDAIDDDAAKFYRKFGFQPVIGNPRRLVMKIATVRKSLS
jgi:predicted GNAT family N-acyltransferase